MSTKHWHQKQLRILQTVLREPDVVDYDAEAVVNYMEEIHSNCIIINAGGILDFFYHDLATANPNPFMKHEDILKDLTEAAHRKGMKVIVRVDFRGVDKRIYDLQPDWFQLDENGEPCFFANNPHIPNPLYAPCYLSYYRNEHAFKFTDILFSKYDIDGVWENSPFQSRACYCKKCQAKYREDLGKEIPRGGEYRDTMYDEYRTWKSNNFNNHLEAYRKNVKKHGEDKVYCAEIFGLFYEHYLDTSSDLYQVKDHFDFLVTPLFTANHEPLHAPTTLMKFLKGLEPDKTPVMLFGHLGTNNQLRYISSSEPESRIWLWQAVSAGGSIWDTIFIGQSPVQTYDRRNAYLVKDVYAYMEEHEELLANQLPEADVHLLYSRNSNNYFNHNNREKDAYITHFIGMEHLLQTQNLQYSFLLDQQLSKETLKQVKCLAIPNGTCLSDEELELIKDYVHGGGNILATNETSLYYPDGTERDDLGLAEVFGCTYTGIKKEGSTYGYQKIRQTDHPMAKGLEDTELTANWGKNLLVLPTEGANTEVPITYVPQIYPQSPERAWPRSFDTKYPSCIINNYGKGKALYFPYPVDRNVWMHGHRDFRTLLSNAFDYLLDDKQMLTSSAPASVNFQLNRVKTEDGTYMLHMINTTSAPFRPVLEIIPVHDIEINLELDGRDVASFDVLKGEGIELVSQNQSADGKILLKIKAAKLDEYASICIRTKTFL